MKESQRYEWFLTSYISLYLTSAVLSVYDKVKKTGYHNLSHDIQTMFFFCTKYLLIYKKCCNLRVKF